MSIFRQSVVRVRAGEKESRAGDKVADWSDDAVDRLPVHQLSVQPSTQREEEDGQSDLRITGYRILSEPGTTPDINGLDRIEYRGATFVVNGEVAYWPDPHGKDHIELLMTGFEGG
jgi:hypothetical protein